MAFITTKIAVAAMAIAFGTAHAESVFHAKERAQLCADLSPQQCKPVDASVLMERMQWGSDPWRVRVIENGGFVYYRVKKDEIEPAIGVDGAQLKEICMPGSAGVVNRTEVGPNGQLFLKRYAIMITCRDGRSYTKWKALN